VSPDSYSGTGKDQICKANATGAAMLGSYKNYTPVRNFALGNKKNLTPKGTDKCQKITDRVIWPKKRPES